MAGGKKSAIQNKDKVSQDRLHRRVRMKARHHYFRVMPNNPHHRALIWTVFWVVSGIILVQLMYPPTRAVPTAMLNGRVQGWQDEASLAARINKLFDNTSVSLKLDGDLVEVPLKKLGAEPDTSAMIGRMTNYPFWQRYVPLSVFMQPAQLDTMTVTYTNTVASERCRELASELSFPATNARLELKDGHLFATDEQPGRNVDPEKLCRTIQAATIKLGTATDIKVPADQVKPERTSSDFAAVREQAERALAREVVFTHEDREYRPKQSQIASWIVLSEENGRTALSVDETRVKSYLEELNKSVGTPAGRTKVSVVDGRETGREVGKNGQRIVYRPAIDSVKTLLLEDTIAQPIILQLENVSPTVIYNNRYTATEAGLQAYVNDAARDYNARISLRQLGGNGWEVAARQNESIPSASTYKIFVAAWLFDQMKQGKINWSTPILDTDTSTCFDRMTIASTNACAQEWLTMAGRENMNRFVYGLGASRGTSFTNPTATHTTAADLTNHMTKLARGELYDDVYRQRLYKSLSTHPYRYGIPVGSSGQVYDKVGFLWDYVHDTAIVKHPKGDYVLTIMTKGQSYSRIASITREIERIMYP